MDGQPGDARLPASLRQSRRTRDKCRSASVVPNGGPSRPPAFEKEQGMSEQTKTGLCALGAAVALGVWGDWLLRATPWGYNLPAWLAGLGLAVVWLGLSSPVLRSDKRFWLIVPALLFATAFAWRDAPMLRAANLLAVGGLLALAAPRRAGHPLRAGGLLDYLAEAVLAAAHAVAGMATLLMGDIAWNELPRGRAGGTAFAVARGVVIALPVLLLFGFLLGSADEVFARLLDRLFHWDAQSVASHVLLWGALAWLTGGYLRGLVTRRSGGFDPRFSPEPRGAVEGAIVLALVDVLFLAFVMIQVRYLFGGAAQVAATGLTYAEYARRGFFELTWVTALALPLLLVTHAMTVGPGSAPRRRYAVLAGVMTLLLFVIIASAMKRMRMYVDVYGLTELRLYTTAFMAWLAVVFVWFAATVLRGRRAAFAFGVLAAAIAALLALNAANPDAVIVRANAGAGARAHWDEDYMTSLSADAVPALVRALPTLPPRARAAMACRLLQGWTPDAPTDWRTSNGGRAAARAVVAARRPALERWRDAATPTEWRSGSN
jgi:hypothetical protein